jgi:hypothetical protein
MGTSHHIEDEDDENAALDENEGSQTDFNNSSVKLGASSK